MESHHSGRSPILNSTFFEPVLYFFLSCLFISGPHYLFSELPEEEMTISSGEADYDGQTITLEGEVSVLYGLGKIAARHLTVLPSEQKGRFSHFIIRDNILIELRGGGLLKCEKAEIDYSLMKGSFFGSEEIPDVIYENSEKGASSLVIKSKKMEVELIRLPIPGNLGLKTMVKDFLAQDLVRIYFNQSDSSRGEYLLTADQACYTPFNIDLNAQGGLIDLSSNGSNPYCILINPDGDRVQARRIEFNTLERTAFLTEAKGVLKGMDFEADQVVLNDKNQTMTFKGNIKIQEEGLIVDTDHELVIHQKNVDGKK
jgi:lipopolysaccharide export system protein LptA